MRRGLTRLLVAFGLARGAARARRPPPPEDGSYDPSRYETGSPRWAEPLLAGLLVLSGLLFAAFAVLVAVEPDTQLLGGTLGGGLLALAGGLVLAGKRVLPQETAVEERPQLDQPEARQETAEDLRHGLDGVSRRKLLAAAAGVAGTGLTAAVALPATALGPAIHGEIEETPWRAGVPLVGEADEPVRVEDVAVGSFITAFPRGADKRELGSPVVVVRVEPETLQLPAGRRSWAPLGLLAFSKICTHAGCAVSLFRYPVYEELSSRPALVCPCHYSTFDVRRAATVIAGPAGRALPQLPLDVVDGVLVAAGPMSGSIGPAWWGTEGGYR